MAWFWCLLIPIICPRFTICAKENHTSEKNSSFWERVYGEKYISKLNSGSLLQFLSEHEESFIMFYANWCQASQDAKHDFTKLAEELMDYTEGYHIAFGAVDCNATMSNRQLCKHWNVTSYPRFHFFKSGNLERIYNIECPFEKEFLYSWIVNNGNESYCSVATKTGIKNLLIPVGMWPLVALVVRKLTTRIT